MAESGVSLNQYGTLLLASRMRRISEAMYAGAGTGPESPGGKPDEPEAA